MESGEAIEARWGKLKQEIAAFERWQRAGDADSDIAAKERQCYGQRKAQIKSRSILCGFKLAEGLGSRARYFRAGRQKRSRRG